MNRRAAALIAAGLLLIALGILFFFLARPRPAPVVPEPELEAPAGLPADRHAVLNLYFGTPFVLRDVERLELTILRVDAVSDGGIEYPVSETAARVMAARGVAQKVASAAVYQGGLERLRLTFGPTARLFRAGGGQELAFLPNVRMDVLVNAEIPVSRTLAVLLAFPPNAALGDRNGTPTVILPDEARGETFLLGGYLLNPRDAGQILEPETNDLAGIIKADLGFDIRPREGERGSAGFAPAPGGQPSR